MYRGDPRQPRWHYAIWELQETGTDSLLGCGSRQLGMSGWAGRQLTASRRDAVATEQVAAQNRLEAGCGD